MHRLSVVSLAALLAVGGVLAFVVFASPHVTAAPPTPQAMGLHPSSTGTNGTLLSQPPAPAGGGGDDDGSTFDS